MEISASVSKSIPFYVLIAAAGNGSRFGGPLPKQYALLHGKPIIHHTVNCFRHCLGLQEMRVIIASEHQHLYEDCFIGSKAPRVIKGGINRFNSINNGIDDFSNLNDEDIILIHDGARPFITTTEIEQLVTTAANYGAATLGQPITDTIKYVNGNYVDRNGLWSLQTPQAFRFGLLKRAHVINAGQTPTDDTGLVAALGHHIELVLGNRDNIKITTQEDLQIAEKIMAEKMTSFVRTGLGFDVHAFSKDRPGPLRLCGVDVPYHHALDGHSDADVGLHALTDALLGALAGGDIGQHFPPSDPKWRGADSTIFLKHANNLLKKRGGIINNLDITLICEMPKIGPHAADMQKCVAEICGLVPGQVGIKATTTERLGFTGRGEGIAAQAIATITLQEWT